MPSDTMHAPLSIVELVGVCAHMEQRNLTLFTCLGEWARNGCDNEQLHPSDRRRIAEACHQHAWHAELWAARRPQIDHEPTDVAPTVRPGVPSDYPDVIDIMMADVRALGERVDRHLDPSTHRVVTLVADDLTRLRARLVKPHF